jgi:hypothetical protein
MMSSSQSLVQEQGLGSADGTSIYRDGSGNLWVSFEPFCLPDGGPEFSALDANSAEFSSLITCLEARYLKITSLYALFQC